MSTDLLVLLPVLLIVLAAGGVHLYRRRKATAVAPGVQMEMSVARSDIKLTIMKEWLGFPRLTLQPGERKVFEQQAQVLVKILRVFLPPEVATSVAIVKFMPCEKSNLVNGAPIPGQMLAEDAWWKGVEIPTCQPGCWMRIEIENVSDVPVTLAPNASVAMAW